MSYGNSIICWVIIEKIIAMWPILDEEEKYFKV